MFVFLSFVFDFLGFYGHDTSSVPKSQYRVMEHSKNGFLTFWHMVSGRFKKCSFRNTWDGWKDVAGINII